MTETLELKIKSTADQAAKSIGNLETKLNSLNGALSAINSSGLKSFSSGLRELSSSIKSLSGIDSRSFSKIANNVSKIGNINTKQLASSAIALRGMSKSLSSFAGLAGQSTEISTIVSSISKLGSKSASNAAVNIKQLGLALKEVMKTLSGAPTVNRNIIEMTNSLANLSAQGSKVGTASRSLISGFGNIGKSIKSTKSSFGGLSRAIGKFYATYWLIFRAISKIREAVGLSSQLTEVQNVVDTTFGNMSSKIEEFAETSIQSFGMSELTSKKIASRYQAMGTAMGISSSQISKGTDLINKKLLSMENTAYSVTNSTADMSVNLTKLAADMASFYNVEQEDVAKALESIYTGQTRPLRQYGLDLTQATLQEWAMKNGIDANVKSMSQAEKTLLRYQYVMANTTAAQGDFTKTANTWANSVRILKEEVKAWGMIIGQVVIGAFKPLVNALNKVMLKVISFTRTIADALGSIFGWTIEINGGNAVSDEMDDVSDSIGGIGDSASGANQAAKELKKTLLSIDEIHALSDNDSSSGGGTGGGGASGSEGGLNSSLKPVDGLIKKYESSIKSLYELGAYIGDAITKSLNSIDWDSVYQGAKDFGTGLADFLNGLISPELFGAVGKSIAGSLRTSIITALSFVREFDWVDLGNSIAAFVNSFFDEMGRISPVTGMTGWEELAHSIVEGVHGALTTAITTLEQTDFDKIGQAIGDFIGEIDFETIVFDLSKLALAIINALKDALVALFEEDPLSATIVTGIGIAKLTGISDTASELISNKLSGLSVKIAGLTLAFSGITMELEAGNSITNDILAPILTGLGLKLMGASWQLSVTVSLVLLLSNIGLEIGNRLAGTDYTWADIFGEFTSADFWGDLFTYLGQDIKNWLFDIRDFWGDLFYYLLEDIKKYFKKLASIVYNAFADVINGLIDLINRLPFVDIPKMPKIYSDEDLENMKTIASISTKVSDKIIQDATGVKTNLHKNFDDANDYATDTVKNIGKAFSDTNDLVKQFGDSARDNLIKLADSTINTKNTINNLGNSISDLPNKAYAFTKFGNTANDSFKKVDNSISSTKTNIGKVADASDSLSKKGSSSFSSFSNSAKTNFASSGDASDRFKTKLDLANTSLKTLKGYTSNSFKLSIKESGLTDVTNKVTNLARSLSNVFQYSGKKLTLNSSVNAVGNGLINGALAIRGYASGGFPDGEDGLFYANHSELVGKFSNGKTAVANNEQITEGIKQAVIEGMMQVAMSTSNAKQSEPIIENIFKVDSETLYRMTQKGKKKYDNRYNIINEF